MSGWWDVRRAAAALLLVTGTGILACYDLSSTDGAPSIAVLPFLDLTGAEESGVADQFTRQLTDDLGTLSGLRVVASTTSFLFKDRQLSAHTVGQRLQVNYLVEGSIRRISASYSQVAVRLVRAQEGLVIYEDTYEEPLRPAFDGLAGVAKAATASLRAALGGDLRR